MSTISPTITTPQDQFSVYWREDIAVPNMTTPIRPNNAEIKNKDNSHILYLCKLMRNLQLVKKDPCFMSRKFNLAFFNNMVMFHDLCIQNELETCRRKFAWS